MRAREAAFEYSHAESDMRWAYYQATRRDPGLLIVADREAGFQRADHFVMRETADADGLRIIRLFIRDGCEAEVRELAGSAAVDRIQARRAKRAAVLLETGESQ